MKLRPNGAESRGLLHRNAQYLLGRWRELCEELALAEAASEATSHLEVNVCEARNDFASFVAGYGQVVIRFDHSVVSEEGLELPGGYYVCDIKDARPQVNTDAKDPDRGQSYENPHDIRLWLVLYQARKRKLEKVDVVLALKQPQLTEIYFTA